MVGVGPQCVNIRALPRTAEVVFLEQGPLSLTDRAEKNFENFSAGIFGAEVPQKFRQYVANKSNTIKTEIRHYRTAAAVTSTRLHSSRLTVVFAVLFDQGMFFMELSMVMVFERCR